MLHRPGKNKKEKRAESKRKRKKHKKRPTVERQHVVCEDSGDSGCGDEISMTARLPRQTRTPASLPSSPRLASPAPTFWYDCLAHWVWVERRAVEEVD